MNASAHPMSASDSLAGPHPILIIAGSDAARLRAREPVEAGGFRAVPLTFDEAPARLEIQPGLSAIWIEVDGEADERLDALLDQVQADVRSGRCPAVVSAPLGLIDRIEAQLREPGTDLLIDATPSDRAVALARLVTWTVAKNAGVNDDVSRDSGDARLRQLSDEISRIAATLARLSTGPGQIPVEKPEPAGEAPPVSLETVRQVIRSRRLRARYFDEEMFADPAWDMLLDLLQAEIAQHRVPVSSLCIAAAVPATTALRWIKSMTDAGLFKRRADPHDGRRVFVELAPQASDALRRYFKEVGKAVVV
jgi:DNA-binding MarR family transcriptional regulator